MAQLDKTFPTKDCSMCIMSPKLVEVGRHPDIELITLAETREVTGKKGDFTVLVYQKPRDIDVVKCIVCGECAAKCPQKVMDAFNEGLVKRKAVYIPYPQAVPLKYAIDAEQCLYLTKGKCGTCAKPCSGPTSGHLTRMSDHQEPRKIAWLQCIGSRDTNQCRNAYWSSVCCMYAIKQAIIAKEHAPYPLDCSIFYMGMRTHGKGFEACFHEVRSKHGIRFIRSRVHTVAPDPASGDLTLQYAGEDGRRVREDFDLVILSVGLEIPEALMALCNRLGLDLTPGGFVRTPSFQPVATSRDGIYVCGVLQGPKAIPQSVVEAGSAALMTGAALHTGRGPLVTTREMPAEAEITGEPPRIGVLVCRCGININGVVDVPAVRDYARNLPHVAYVEDNLYTCSQDTQDIMTRVIREKGLNRIVAAACSPKTHEPLFQETLVAAGLNKYLLEFVNIRN